MVDNLLLFFYIYIFFIPLSLIVCPSKEQLCLLTRTFCFFLYAFIKWVICCRFLDDYVSLSHVFCCVLSCHDKRPYIYHMILYFFFLFLPHDLLLLSILAFILIIIMMLMSIITLYVYFFSFLPLV